MNRVLLGALAATAVAGACTRTVPPAPREQLPPPPTTLEQAPTSGVPLATPPTTPARPPSATVRERGSAPPPAPEPTPSSTPSTARTPAPSPTAASPANAATSIVDVTGQCTDLVGYAGDHRPLREINAIGRQSGSCPPPERP